MVVDFESAKDGELSVKSNGVVKKTFKFDSIFCPQTDQGTKAMKLEKIFTVHFILLLFFTLFVVHCLIIQNSPFEKLI